MRKGGCFQWWEFWTPALGSKVSWNCLCQFISVSVGQLTVFLKNGGSEGGKNWQSRIFQKNSHFERNVMKFLQIGFFFSFCQKFNPISFNLFALKWFLTVFLIILRKLHVWKKSNCSVTAYTALVQSDYSFLWLSISLEGNNRYLMLFIWR